MTKARRVRKLVPVKKVPPKVEPFHVVKLTHNDKHVGYDIYVNNRPFLKQSARETRLKRHEAYAIVALLNGQEWLRKWAEKFSDPYV